MPIDRVYIKNYKSIQDSGDIEIRPINILIGANGVGKSNFISFFKMLNSIYQQRLRNFIADNGYVDRLLYLGRKRSAVLEGGVVFRPLEGNTNNRYDFKLVPQTNGNGLYFEEDNGGYNLFSNGNNENWSFINLGGVGQPESGLRDNTSNRADYLSEYFEDFKVFHFHDTSSSSPLKKVSNIRDYATLREDGSNLAAFLFMMRETHLTHFKMIESVIRSVAPFFERFDLYPDTYNSDLVSLNWIGKGSNDYFDAFNLSDGTIRFIALAALLLQPDPPKTIIIDEPELGLHPFAIAKLAGMLQSVPETTQIIISTQSVTLLDQFSAEDIIVVQAQNNTETVFKRLSKDALEVWLKDYSLGELWRKNILGGRP